MEGVYHSVVSMVLYYKTMCFYLNLNRWDLVCQSLRFFFFFKSVFNKKFEEISRKNFLKFDFISPRKITSTVKLELMRMNIKLKQSPSSLPVKKKLFSCIQKEFFFHNSIQTYASHREEGGF